MSSDGNETYGNYSTLDNQESPLYTAKFDYQAQGRKKTDFAKLNIF